MAYQALYRVWRSQRFEDVVGQKAITQTLKNAIEQIKFRMLIYLPVLGEQEKRGAAKIFAKAINCPNQVNGEPCNECEMCRSITAGTQRRRYRNRRSQQQWGSKRSALSRDRANYAPTQAEYKVYIVDEVRYVVDRAPSTRY